MVVFYQTVARKLCRALAYCRPLPRTWSVTVIFSYYCKQYLHLVEFILCTDNQTQTKENDNGKNS